MNNPNAFPVTYTDKSTVGEETLHVYTGMSLRDYFAAKAMTLAFDYVRRVDACDSPNGMGDANECRYDMEWTNDDDGPGSDLTMVAEYSYLLADAMLKAREA